MKNFIIFFLLGGLGCAAMAQTPDQTAALHIADFLISLQNADGVIPDAPGSPTANEDSNMEYALIGLAAAYQYSGDSRYLSGLEKGIRWLALRENMSAPKWKGSWYYAYRANRPYSPVAVSPGPRIANVRGVSATSALFPYLLFWHARLSGTNALVIKYGRHAKAALDFILARNQSADGFFFNSWHQKRSGSSWLLWRFQYSADQADVYLGLQAGGLLFNNNRYLQAAARIASRLGTAFFLASHGRYALGRDNSGTLDPEMEGFNGLFPQGYIPWILGPGIENRAAFQWLSQCRQPDGRLICAPGDPAYSMSAALDALAAHSLSEPEPRSSLDWILSATYDPQDGGVRDTADPGDEKYSNVAGFTIMAFLRFLPF